MLKATFNALEPYNAITAPLIGAGSFATTLAGATATTNVRLSASENISGAVSANALLLTAGGMTLGESAASSLTIATGLLGQAELTVSSRLPILPWVLTKVLCTTTLDSPSTARFMVLLYLWAKVAQAG